VLYSTRSVFAKVEHALGAFCAGLALQLAGLPAKAVPSEVPSDVIWRIAIIDGPVAVIPGLIAAFFYAQYRIDRASYDATRAKLLAYREELARRGPRGAAGAAALMTGPREYDANPPTT
jgi:glycoside/pentoside/hexuronide:cation symporter, GPH family